MKRFRLTQALSALIVVLLHVTGATGQDAQSPAEPKRYHIGYRILKAPREGQAPLVVALWYPTNAGPGKMRYHLIGAKMESDATPDAPPAKGPFPLVIYSHGGGGCAIMGATHAEALAESGFVVAGPDHNDDFIVERSDHPLPPDPNRARDWLAWAQGISGGGQKGKSGGRYAHRPAEVRAAIDYLLAENNDAKSALHGLIDPQKIGAMGVSFGAWTTQAASGFLPMFPTFRDERIKAAVPIAGPTPKLQIGSFANVKIPVMIIFGGAETIILGDSRSGSKTEGMIRNYESASPPKFLIEIKGAHHLDFGGAGVSRREQSAGGGPVSTVDVRNNDRVIATVNRYCVAFFRRYLLGDQSAEKILTTQEPNVVLLKYETGPR